MRLGVQLVACPVLSFLVSCLVSYNRNFSCNNVDLKNPGYIWFRVRMRQGKGKRKGRDRGSGRGQVRGRGKVKKDQMGKEC